MMHNAHSVSRRHRQAESVPRGGDYNYRMLQSEQLGGHNYSDDNGTIALTYR